MPTIQDTHAQAEQQINHARNNADLSEDAKRRAIARAYVALKDELAVIGNAEQATAQARRETLARKVYGIPQLADAGAMISYRDAVDRANQISDKEQGIREAITALTSARTAGDDYLVRAVLRVAYERAWGDVILAYIALEPKQEADATELWEITVSSTSFQANFIHGFELYAPVPPELAGYNELTIRELAKA